MLHEIIQQVSHLWRAPNCQADITFVDDGISELVRWCSQHNNDAVDFATVLSLGMDLVDLMLIQSYGAKRVLFCLSHITADVLRKVKKLISLSGASDAIILTLVSPDAFKAVSDSSQFLIQLQPGSETTTASKERSYDFLRSYLKPECVDIVYYPVHCFPVLSSSKCERHDSKVASTRNQCELFNLSSPMCRDIKPLTLHGIGQWNVNENIKHISDVSAGDIPIQNSVKLKTFAHELAGTLIFDLGLDPSSSIYALGITSSLVGRYLQPLLTNLGKTRCSLKRTEKVQSTSDGTEILLSSTSNMLSSNSTFGQSIPIDAKVSSLFPLPPKTSTPAQNSLFPLPKKSTSQQTAHEAEEINFDANKNNNKNIDHPQVASLLIIDRTQDLYSPSYHSGETSKATPGSGQILTPPLAHRILCTLLRESSDNNQSNNNGSNKIYDIALLPPFSTSTINSNASSSSSSSNSNSHTAAELDLLKKSFPAVSSLSVQFPMSLCLPHSNSSDNSSNNNNDINSHNNNNNINSDNNDRNRSMSNSNSNNNSNTSIHGSRSNTHGDDNNNDMALLHQAIFAASEEEGRRLLCAALTAKILMYNGVLPVSKKGRGLGAEVLSLVQALIVASGTSCVGYGSNSKIMDSGSSSKNMESGSSSKNMESGSSSKNKESGSESVEIIPKLGFDVSTCRSTQTLLSFSMLVVEAMQRSSKKQFTQYAGETAQWMTSCETRAARELHTTRLLKNGSTLDRLILHLTEILEQPTDKSSPSTPGESPRTPPTTSIKAVQSATSVSEGGPKDVVHLLIQLLRVMSFLGIAPEEEKGKNLNRAGDGGKNSKSNGENEKQKNSDLFSRSDFSHLKNPNNNSVSANTNTHGNDNKGRNKEINSANEIRIALKGFMTALSFYLKLHSPIGELKYLSKIGLISPYLVEDMIKLRPLQQSNLTTSQSTAKETETNKTKEKENMDDEWDDFGDDEESGLIDENDEKEKNQDGNEELFRLELEVQDFIDVLTGRFLELGTLSGLSKKLLDKNISNTNNVLEDQNRNSSESNKNEIENTNHVFGVVAQSVASFLNRRHRQESNIVSQSSLSNVALHTKFYNLINDGEKMQEEMIGNRRGNVDILSAFEFIESPLQIMKRAGLDLISTGWGRLGFTSGATPSSSGSTNKEGSYASVLVVCVVGGLSFIEVAQVQSVLSEYVTNNPVLPSSPDSDHNSYTRVILISNNSISPENSLNFIF